MSTSGRKRLPVSVFSKRLLVAFGVGLAATLLAALAGRYSDFVQRVENASYDWRVKRTARPAAPESPVVILDINESTVRALEPHVGRWPWPRAVHAGAIDYLTRAGAKVVAYDVLFGERAGRGETIINGQAVSGDDSDRAFVESVRAAGNVILLGETTFEGAANPEAEEGAAHQVPLHVPGPVYAPGEGWRGRPDLQLPFAELAGAARAIGHNLLARDPGSDFARRMLPFVEVHGVAIPSLGTAAAMAYRELQPEDVQLEGASLRLGDRHMPLVAAPVVGNEPASHAALLRFRAPVTGTDEVVSVFPSYSFFDVLLSNDQLAEGKTPAVPPEAFAGKLVFVGTSAAGTFDRYLTPFERGAGGVELHATLADNIISGQFMRRAAWSTDVALALAAGLGAGASALLLPVAGAIGLVAVMIVGLGTWLTRLVGEGLWISAMVPGLAASLALFGGVSWQYFVEGREKRYIKRLFGRYVSRDVIDQLLVDPSLASLGGQRREMTVLFSDIRGFTTASEQGTPEDVVAQLNEYFGSMVEVLFRHQGTLDKFVGDMVMGLFGAPLADPAHADHAVAAALDMIEALERLNARWHAEGRPTLDIGIGVNTGEMIAGNIGAEAIMSYTVIGDAVNLGARLESLNKEYGTHILISEATRARLTIPVGTREIGAVTVKGKTHATTVHEVTGRAAPVRLETEHSR